MINNKSEIINKLFFNELKELIDKYNNIDKETIIVIERIHSEIEDKYIKEYILRLQNYLNSTNFKCIKAEFKGIEFDVSKNLSFDDIFNEYYSKYDKIYGISQMLSDLGLK